jgi:hypothetical protein
MNTAKWCAHQHNFRFCCRGFARCSCYLAVQCCRRVHRAFESTTLLLINITRGTHQWPTCIVGIEHVHTCPPAAVNTCAR